MNVREVICLALLAAGAVFGAANQSNATAGSQTERRFESEIRAFAEADRAKPPVPGGILFVGSSIFRQWTNVAEMMAPLPVSNRAFGGSRTGDQLERFDQVVLPYAPRVIVYYCGSNDIKADDLPDAIFERFKSFSERVRRAFPETRILFVSSTRSPDRVPRWDRVDRYNQLVREYCAATPHHVFIDVNPALFDPHGKPRLELYQDDQLHFKPPAYVEFAAVIRPVLTQAWKEVAVGTETSTPTRVLRLRVDRDAACQVIDGFGASDAWQCDIVGKNWPQEKRERIADLLFSREVDAQGNPRGIGLSIWRFNIGAGTAEQGNGSDIKNPWRRAECFQKPDGTYDWSRQAGQQWFLKAARQRGVEKFLAFPNAPPVHLASNGKGYAPKGSPHFNLKPGKLNDYAVFLTDALEHFDKAGQPFDYLSPFNEPQWAWDGAGQEGTPALNSELYPFIRDLSKELARRKLSTRLVIGEAGNIDHLMKKMGDGDRSEQAQFFFSPSSPSYIGDLPNVAPIISAHSYHSVWPLDQQVKSRELLHNALASANPKLGYWMSEYCILERNDEIRGGGRRDLGMNTALFVARIIHHDLTIAQARSWQWWTAVSQVDYKDGLVYLDDGSLGDSGRMGPATVSLMHDGVVRESKLLWVVGNYSRFVRPGMVRVKCELAPQQSYVNGVLGSAFKAPDGRLIVVLVNLSQDGQRCDLGSAGDVETYTTSANANLAKRTQNAANVVIPARAVVTCICR